MSHYTVTVKDGEGGVIKTSGYMPLSDGTGRFQVTNLVTGTYTIDVSGYIQTGESSYSLIATGTETAAVSAAMENSVVIEIDTFDDAYTGDITVDITMPVDVVISNTVTGTLSWTLAAIGNDELSFTGSETLSGTALEDGVYTLVIGDGNIPAGRYLLTVTLDNGTPYSSVEAVVAYPGLPSTGTLSLDSRKPADYSFTVTDMIGGELAVNGEGEYVAETGTFVVTLSEGLSETEKAIWYVDGEESVVQKGEGNAYTITGLDGGRHIVVLVVYDTAQESAVGSLTIAVEVQGELTIEEPPHFLYTDNGDGTCTITGENPDNPLPSHDGLTIPDEIDGLKVTTIGVSAFNEAGFSGALVIPDSVISIEYRAFSNNSFTGNLNIPDNVTIIDTLAFADNSFNGTLTLGKKLQTINNQAFINNSFIGDLVIPDSVTIVNYMAFQSNSFDGTLTLGKSLQTIGFDAFRDNTFTGNLFIPISVNTIGFFVFKGSDLSAIFCEVASQPSEWSDRWNDYNTIPVFWGVSKADYDSIVAGTFAVAEPVISVSDANEVTITSDTSFAHIYYTTDGSEPTAENGTLYEGQFTAEVGTTVKAVAYVGMETYSEVVAEDVKESISVPMMLPDGSILFYDRGASYGTYHFGDDGFPVRDDGAVDDGTAESENWRYLICEKDNLENSKEWGPDNSLESTKSGIGYGLPNTDTLIAKYADYDFLGWGLIKARRDETGLDWFLPSLDELEILIDNRTKIISCGGVFDSDNEYWSSTDLARDQAFSLTVGGIMENYCQKNHLDYWRLVRRI